MAGALVALVIASAATLAIPVAVRRLIDFGFSADHPAMVNQYFAAMLAVVGVLALASAARYWFVTTLGERVVADLRNAVFRHLTELTPAFYDGQRSGEIVSRLTADTTQIKSVFGATASQALRNLFLFLGAAVMMVVTSPKLSACVLLAIPAIVLPLAGFGRSVRRRSRAAQDTLADASALASEAIGAMRTVQSHNAEGLVSGRFRAAVERAYHAAESSITARAILTAIAIFLIFASVVGVLWYGASAVLAKTMSAGELGQFVLYAVFAAAAIGELSNVWGEIEQAAGSAANLRSLPGAAEHPRYRFEHADIRDAEAMRRVFDDHRPTAVMNLAAESHVDRSIDAPGVFIETNVTGTYVVLQEALRRFRALEAADQDSFRLLHVSTDEVFGSLGPDGLFREDTPYSPNSPYSASKAASDHLVRAWRETYGLPTIVTNCSNNYGPYHFPEKLIPMMIIRGLEGRDLPVYGRGENVRDWLHVEDHARALCLVLERGAPGESYNVGGRSERRNLDVVETICDLLDRRAPSLGQPRRGLIRFVEDRPGHDLRYAIDASKIERELGWRAEETFESGVEKTVLWYLANESWWRPLLGEGSAAGALERKGRKKVD